MQIDVSDQTVDRLTVVLTSHGLNSSEIPRVLGKILEILASGRWTTIREVVSEMADEDVRDMEESALDVAERMGLVGAFRSGCNDLSTNPIHMDGFGQ